MKAKLAEMAAKREHAIASKSDVEKSTDSFIDDAATAGAPERAAGPKPLPKVTLYAHANVLKSIRLLAVEDGVQAQEILRRAMKDYLASRGHHFEDLTTGK